MLRRSFSLVMSDLQGCLLIILLSADFFIPIIQRLLLYCNEWNGSKRQDFSHSLIYQRARSSLKGLPEGRRYCLRKCLFFLRWRETSSYRYQFNDCKERTHRDCRREWMWKINDCIHFDGQIKKL